MYAEDVDLSWHIRALGYKLMYVPSAVIHHYAYRTAGEEKPTQLAGSVAGNLVLRYKYGDGQDLHSWKKLYRLVEERIENNEQTHAVFHKQMARIQDHKEMCIRDRVTAQALQKHGITADLVAHPATSQALVLSLIHI